ncbi:MAG: hypothetical protein LUG16_05280, partial [Candidatus Gastranaerophilales bacterium]|nr:hypothetical protein [Candidatus Gastranaerophilales bacterium]
MVINQLNEFKKKKFWISTTGYRILIILRALIEGEKSLEELIDILQNDSFVNKAISKDTVRLTLNTLKSAGYKFSRPCKTNNFKYKLLYNPFALNISNEEIKALIILRERLSEELSWQDVLKINDLYEKFTSLSNNQEFKNKINTSQPLNNIDKSILIEISNPKLKGKKIQIKYLS